MTTFSVATLNFGDTGSLADLGTLVDHGADIICTQEMSDRWTTIIQTFLRRHPGWQAYKGGLPGAPADPILVNVDHIGPATVVDHPGVKRRWVGKGRLIKGKWSAAGPQTSKPKPMTQFVLSDGTSVFSLHTIASVTKTEKVLGTRTYNARRKHYRDHLYSLLAVTTTLDGPVIVSGDFNAEPDFDLLAPLHNVGFIGWTTDPTHDTRAIDHVLFLPDRGLTVTGLETVLETDSDHNAVLVPFEQEPVVPPLLTPPYAGPAKFHGGSNNKPINRLVIHATVSECKPGAAAAIARYFRTTVSRPSSAHYVIDPDESFQVVYDSIVAYHAPPNEHSLGFELCFMPVHDPNGMWKEDMHHRMILRAARLVAEAAVLYDVPIVKLGAADLKAGKRGICGHVDVSEAFHQTSHWDPGHFPWDGFMAKVQREADAIRAERRK